MTDYVLEDVTRATWPDVLPWRGPGCRRGYPTREDAERRARVIRTHYNATHGTGGPDLRVRERRPPATSPV